MYKIMEDDIMIETKCLEKLLNEGKIELFKHRRD